MQRVRDEAFERLELQANLHVAMRKVGLPPQRSWETELTIQKDRERRLMFYRSRAGRPYPPLGYQYKVVLKASDHIQYALAEEHQTQLEAANAERQREFEAARSARQRQREAARYVLPPFAARAISPWAITNGEPDESRVLVEWENDHEGYEGWESVWDGTWGDQEDEGSWE
ncbi:hypothetical protein Hypma_014417 [Hypsizygus marmoreus]|uniref:Uncharacterized protein n=1 Tax=Hypsizygus marmoreus TaxID=39966 RepID=A0A369JGS4_HYPMA|nr:hypothetical protein Hypma_014417 [Hypsizygus marmoreus]